MVPDADRRGFLDTQRGVSNGHQDGNTELSGKLHRYEHLRSRTPSHDESESLSSVDDFEVLRYLHSKEEMNCKRIICEEMNREHAKVRHGKRVAETRKDTPPRKALKITVETENEKIINTNVEWIMTQVFWCLLLQTLKDMVFHRTQWRRVIHVADPT